VIQAILFDMGALIYGPTGVDFISEVLRAEAINVEPIEVTEAIDRLPREFHSLRSSIRTEEEENDYNRAMITPLLANLGVPSPTDALLLRIVENLHQYPAWCSMYPEVLPTLQALTDRGFKLGIVANWEPSLQRCVNDFEIQHYFGAVISSMEAGVAKPDPFIFKQALRKLEVGADHALHVGPNLNEDVAGALSAGIRPIWLNRSGIPTGHDILTVTDLLGLLLIAQKAGE
jgi:HAD superfamily hydrolase (TIGR01549 family)